MAWRFGSRTLVDGPVGLAGPVVWPEATPGLGVLDFVPDEDPTGLGVLIYYDMPVPWTPPAPWTLQLCRNGDTIATCSAYEFAAMPVRNGAGDWTLETSPAGIPPTGYADGGKDVPFDPRDVTDVRLVADGRIVFAGNVYGENGGYWVESDERGERWRFTGIERGWNQLGSRLVYPDPATEQPWTVTHDVRTDIASSVLAGYINANAGAGAIAARQIAGLDVADEHAGTSFTFSARLQSLAELATRIATDGGFEVLPEHGFDGSITFRLSAVRDRSDDTRFSDQGDLLSSSSRFQHRDATHVLTGGAGDGTARTFRSADTGATGDDRYEVFSDQSSMTSTSEVQADADTKLALAGQRFQISTTLTDQMTTFMLQSGLRIGDKVGVFVRGRLYVAPIEAMQFEVTPERQILRPRFGAALPNELTALLRKVSQLGQPSSIA